MPPTTYWPKQSAICADPSVMLLVGQVASKEPLSAIVDPCASTRKMVNLPRKIYLLTTRWTSMPSESKASVIVSGFLEPAPFAVLRKQVEALKSLSREEQVSILTCCSLASLQVVRFDETWYLSAYPDIQAAVEKGEFNSGLHHYEVLGYFEGRLPFEIDVDEEYYSQQNPDVRRAITTGMVAGAKLHFLTKGYKEGRVPSRDYSFFERGSQDAVWRDKAPHNGWSKKLACKRRKDKDRWKFYKVSSLISGGNLQMHWGAAVVALGD